MTERQQPPQEPSDERRFARIRRTMDRINAWLEQNPDFLTNMMRYPGISPYSYQRMSSHQLPLGSFFAHEKKPENLDTGRSAYRDPDQLNHALMEEFHNTPPTGIED